MLKYKGYLAKTEVDPETGLIFGEVFGLRDMITFQGWTGPEAIRKFRESVDLYLVTCEEQGIEPEKPYSGSILVRTEPKVHGALAALAGARGQSLNDLVNRLLRRAVRKLSSTERRSGSSRSPEGGGKPAARDTGGSSLKKDKPTVTKKPAGKESQRTPEKESKVPTKR
jgi:predicted HicB family RNase H-like nuclease